MTGQYATLGNDPVGPAITMVAQADYHLAELDRMADALDALGLATRIVVPVIAWKPMYSRRPTVRRLRQLVAGSGRVLAKPISVHDLVAHSSAVLVMNDWGVPRLLVESAVKLGIPTFGWVEGVQDYDDVDTGLARGAYRRVDHVFALGPASCAVLGEDRSTPVGSERLLRLWQEPGSRVGSEVLINSNFTYGVFVEARREWVAGVVEACGAAGHSYALSRHSAERGRSRFPASDRPIDELLPRSSRLVSRFSTVNLDALVLGVELAYHNPHGERVPMFADPQGAFDVTTDVAELTDVLRQPVRPREAVRAAAAPFIQQHVLLDASSTPSARAAAVIEDRIASRA